MRIKASDIARLGKQAISSWSEDNASRLSAALAYYTMVSLAPLLVLSVVMLGWFVHNADNAKHRVEAQVSQLLGPVGATAAREMIESGKLGGSTVATIVSLAILLFGASGVFGELQDSMNTIWGVKLKPNLGALSWIRKRFLSMAMVFGVCFLLLVSLVVSAVLSTLTSRISGGSNIFGYIVDLTASLVVVSGLFAMIFRMLPDVKIAWSDTMLGAVLTAILFTIGKIGLGIYLTKGSTVSAYGAVGSLAALLIWIYYSAQIMFLGAEFTKAYANEFGSNVVPDDEAVGVTDEMRAQQGIPPKHAVQQAADLVEKLDERKSPGVVAPAVAAAVAGVGGVVVGWMVRALSGPKTTPPPRATRKAASAAHLKERLDDVERRFEYAKAAMESPKAARLAARRWGREWKDAVRD